MRILVINNAYPDVQNPTIYVFVHRQVKALKSAGFDVCVLDIDLRSVRWKRKFGVYKDTFDGVTVYRVSIPFVTVKLRYLGKWLNEEIGIIMIKKIISDWGLPDILHAHFGFGAGNAGVAMKKRLRIPLVITEHSSKVLLSSTKDSISLFCEAYEGADAIVTVSHCLYEKLDSYKIKRLAYIPNIIDTSIFKPQTTVKEKVFTVVSVGHLIKTKNHQLTIRAVQKLNQMGIECNLIIIGRGPERDELLKIRKECFEERVTFIDSIKNEELPFWYRKSHCFVMPSKVETFGVVYAEAIACGIPVISLNNGGTEDIILKENGIILDKEDIDSLADAINYIRENLSFYKAEILHNSIRERFGGDNYIRSVMKLYEELILTPRSYYED